MRPHLTLLDDAGLERLRAATLDVLGNTGVAFKSAAARAVLRDAGARVDDESGVVWIPPDLVEATVAAAPREIVLGARDGLHDLLLDGGTTHPTHDGIGAYVLDHRTFERRQATLDDLRAATLVGDALDEVALTWYAVNPSGSVEPRLEGVLSSHTLLTASGKHAQGAVLAPRDVPYVMELAGLASPGGRWDPARPVFSAIYCPVSPLQHEADAVEAAMALVRQHVPLSIYALPLAGATAPATLAGAIVQTNAEVLSSVVLFQLVEPGCPLVYVANAALMDMHAASYAAASPESMLMNLTLTELGRSYGLPILTVGFSTDAWTPGPRLGAESALMTATGLLAGADILIGMGMLNSANALCLPKLLLDAELWGACRRLARGVELDDEHLMLDLMERVGPGGHYLSAKETSATLRAGEHWRPGLYRRVAYETWQAARPAPATGGGRADLTPPAGPLVSASAGPPNPEWDEAVERVEALLATHTPPLLPDGAEAAMADVVAAAERELPA
ncbi:MAG: trimethylamine methyltransferase family protein [Thermoleophilia bacterium]|jgi:trimethylamine--corrinoid protein Co-methyltransferase|nr:trimethylamine methyltransferase family protein [Thermoleophilia bacterium]